MTDTGKIAKHTLRDAFRQHRPGQHRQVTADLLKVAAPG